MVLRGVTGCMRTTPLLAREVLLGFPHLDLWIRKMAFKAACRLQSHSAKGGLMDWEIVEQLGIQAPFVLDQGPKRWLVLLTKACEKVIFFERSPVCQASLIVIPVATRSGSGQQRENSSPRTRSLYLRGQVMTRPLTIVDVVRCSVNASSPHASATIPSVDNAVFISINV